MTRACVAILALCLGLNLIAAGPDYTSHIATLIDRAKLDTLGERGANPRVQKAVYWLATARANGRKPEKILDDALDRAGGYGKDAAALTKAALPRNLDIADKLGCLDAAGLQEMRRGKAATVQKGP